MGLQPVGMGGMGSKLMGKLLWGWVGDGADVHYHVTLYSQPMYQRPINQFSVICIQF